MMIPPQKQSEYPPHYHHSHLLFLILISFSFSSFSFFIFCGDKDEGEEGTPHGVVEERGSD